MAADLAVAGAAGAWSAPVLVDLAGHISSTGNATINTTANKFKGRFFQEAGHTGAQVWWEDEGRTVRRPVSY